MREAGGKRISSSCPQHPPRAPGPGRPGRLVSSPRSCSARVGKKVRAAGIGRYSLPWRPGLARVPRGKGSRGHFSTPESHPPARDFPRSSPPLRKHWPSFPGLLGAWSVVGVRLRTPTQTLRSGPALAVDATVGCGGSRLHGGWRISVWSGWGWGS